VSDHSLQRFAGLLFVALFGATAMALAPAAIWALVLNLL